MARPSRYAQRGGRHDPRHRVWNSKRWAKVRDQVLARDGHRCQHANAGAACRGGLSVHHLQPIVDAPAYAFDPSNLLTLCSRHHGAVDGKRAVRRGGVMQGGRPPAKPAGNRFLNTAGRPGEQV